MSSPTPPQPPRMPQINRAPAVIITPTQYPANGLPPSLSNKGFVTAEQLAKFVKTMIAGDGVSDTGKTEFMCSAPGPVAICCAERGHEGMLRNQNPPKTRRNDVGFKVFTFPSATAAGQDECIQAWNTYRTEVYELLKDPAIKTVGLDGDSNTYILQRMAEFGKLTQVPAIKYGDVKLKRQAFVNRLNDSGKIILATNRVKAEYVEKINRLTGMPEIGTDGEVVKVKSDNYVPQGLPEEDRDYLWQIVIRHLYKEPRLNPITKTMMPGQYGIRITKCKPKMELIGTELWGEDCWFGGLVQVVYPSIPLEAWGY